MVLVAGWDPDSGVDAVARQAELGGAGKAPVLVGVDAENGTGPVGQELPDLLLLLGVEAGIVVVEYGAECPAGQRDDGVAGDRVSIHDGILQFVVKWPWQSARPANPLPSGERQLKVVRSEAKRLSRWRFSR